MMLLKLKPYIDHFYFVNLDGKLTAYSVLDVSLASHERIALRLSKRSKQIRLIYGFDIEKTTCIKVLIGQKVGWARLDFFDAV
jgi:hypothetical protein